MNENNFEGKEKMIALAALIIIFLSSFVFIASSQQFGSFSGYKQVPHYYISNSLRQTGAANAVSATVWDYRGFDTLGEEIVLFTSLVGVFTVLMVKK